MESLVLAVLLGVVQGVLEWLPVSSEGGVALALSLVTGESGGVSTRFALVLHVGTAVAAFAYYRGELFDIARDAPDWRPRAAFDATNADLSFLGVATLTSGVVGIGVYLLFRETYGLGEREWPDPLDAVLVGAMQGLALLPGVSRSGTTVSVLLLRGHDGEGALRLSFLLSIPASLGAGLLVVLGDGVPAVSPLAAVLALVASAVVGYLTVGALVALVRRVAFWGVCVGFGALAVASGGALMLVDAGLL
ncbi:UDP-diphosphatase [Halobacteriales archaeon QH_8_68_33]|nr:MAG: UDP-diphosphatase [Halobacteriales archaeon QH_8_68_33]